MSWAEKSFNHILFQTIERMNMSFFLVNTEFQLREGILNSFLSLIICKYFLSSYSLRLHVYMYIHLCVCVWYIFFCKIYTCFGEKEKTKIFLVWNIKPERLLLIWLFVLDSCVHWKLIMCLLHCEYLCLCFELCGWSP